MDLKKVGAIVFVILVVMEILGHFTANPRHNQVVTAAADESTLDKWRVSESKSEMDDSKIEVLSLDADSAIQGPLGSYRPTLMIRCKEGKTDAYIVTGMAASVETNLDGGPEESHTVRTRLDDGTAITDGWLQSNDHKALFAPDVIYDREGNVASYSGGVAQFTKQLANARRLTFQFTPFDGNPQTVRFEIQGLRERLNKVAEACSWHVD